MTLDETNKMLCAENEATQSYIDELNATIENLRAENAELTKDNDKFSEQLAGEDAIQAAWDEQFQQQNEVVLRMTTALEKIAANADPAGTAIPQIVLMLIRREARAALLGVTTEDPDAVELAWAQVARGKGDDA